MKNKKIFIITLIIIAILILAVATVSILYFNTDILKTNEQLFTKYLFQGNDTIKAVIDEVYEDQEQFKKDNSYLAEGNLKVTMQNGNDPKEDFNITVSKWIKLRKSEEYEEYIAYYKGDNYAVALIDK